MDSTAQQYTTSLVCQLNLYSKYGRLLEPQQKKEEAILEINGIGKYFSVYGDTSLISIFATNLKKSDGILEIEDSSNSTKYEVSMIVRETSGNGEEQVNLRLDRRTGHFVFTRYNPATPSDKQARGICEKIAAKNKF
jgi:hypothetical protein